MGNSGLIYLTGSVLVLFARIWPVGYQKHLLSLKVMTSQTPQPVLASVAINGLISSKVTSAGCDWWI